MGFWWSSLGLFGFVCAEYPVSLIGFLVELLAASLTLFSLVCFTLFQKFLLLWRQSPFSSFKVKSENLTLFLPFRDSLFFPWLRLMFLVCYCFSLLDFRVFLQLELFSFGLENFFTNLYMLFKGSFGKHTATTFSTLDPLSIIFFFWRILWRLCSSRAYCPLRRRNETRSLESNLRLLLKRFHDFCWPSVCLICSLLILY